MKKIFSIVALALVAGVSTSYAQYAGDALRFSQTNYGSTARFKAMGNAQIANGGDASSLGGNPAGLGFFTRSEFTFTPELNASNSNTNFLNKQTTGSKNQLNLNQAAAVFFMPSWRFDDKSTKKGIVSGVIGVGYMRNNDYSQQFDYSGQNNLNSIRNYFAELANSMGNDPQSISSSTLEGMAYKSYLLNYNAPGTNNLYTANSNGNPFTGNLQNRNETRLGSVSELNFSLAMNIANQVYVGANLGLVGVKYISDAEFTENGSLNPYDSQNGFTGVENYKLNYIQNQETKGSGLNARLGVIFRPDPSFRIGATLQTPTWFTIDDSYSEVLNNQLSNDFFKNTASVYNFSYNLRTPLKGSLGATYIIANRGLISADVDFVDYSGIRFSTVDNSSNASDVSTVNDNNLAIRKNYKSAINYRVGGELKLNQVSLRLGYGLNGSAYKVDPNKLFDTQIYSGGLGYRVNNYYFDLAYQKINTNGNNSPFSLNNGTEPLATSKIARDNFFLTFGIRF
jgi:hypothetical protein